MIASPRAADDAAEQLGRFAHVFFFVIGDPCAA
jgi:hypothetical protein